MLSEQVETKQSYADICFIVSMYKLPKVLKQRGFEGYGLCVFMGHLVLSICSMFDCFVETCLLFAV